MLKILGKVGKGWGTLTGIALLAAGTFAPEAVGQVTLLGQGVGAILQGTGAVLTAFGVGRKAGVALERDKRGKL